MCVCVCGRGGAGAGGTGGCAPATCAPTAAQPLPIALPPLSSRTSSDCSRGRQGIPALVLLDGATGEIISKDGCKIVSSDGIAGFSWKDGVSGGGSKGGNGGPGDTVFRALAATGVEIPEDLSALSLRELKGLLLQCQVSQVDICTCAHGQRNRDRQTDRARARERARDGESQSDREGVSSTEPPTSALWACFYRHLATT